MWNALAMNQNEVALAKAKDLTDNQRTKTHASLDVFASALGVAAGKWVSDVVAELLGKKRPDLIARYNDSELSKIKAELGDVIESWPDKMNNALLEAGIMEAASNGLAFGVLGRAYSAANSLITAEAAPIIYRAFGIRADLQLRRSREHDFPTSVQHLVQASWEDFAADRSKLTDYEVLQRRCEEALEQQDADDRWGRA